MANAFAAFAESVKCAWRLPLSPSPTVRSFADQAFPIRAVTAAMVALALLTALADPESIRVGWDGQPVIPNYALGNILTVFLENAALSLVLLLLGLTIARLLAGPISIDRLASARLPADGFAAVWISIYAIVERNVATFSNIWAAILFLAPLLCAVIYSTWLSYRIGAALTPLRASAAVGVEFLMSILAIVVLYLLAVNHDL